MIRSSIRQAQRLEEHQRIRQAQQVWQEQQRNPNSTKSAPNTARPQQFDFGWRYNDQFDSDKLVWDIES